tara:strand:+ start:2195 stop:2482 length:288 start_codon:yes stop_codon:yes gene_type:complete
MEHLLTAITWERGAACTIVSAMAIAIGVMWRHLIASRAEWRKDADAEIARLTQSLNNERTEKILAQKQLETSQNVYIQSLREAQQLCERKSRERS